MCCIQVLSNADLRAKYDAHGVEGLDVNFMDSAEFFSMLFGSDRFEHLLGELSLAQMTRYSPMIRARLLDQVLLVLLCNHDGWLVMMEGSTIMLVSYAICCNSRLHGTATSLATC